MRPHNTEESDIQGLGDRVLSTAEYHASNRCAKSYGVLLRERLITIPSLFYRERIPKVLRLPIRVRRSVYLFYCIVVNVLKHSSTILNIEDIASKTIKLLCVEFSMLPSI